MTEHDFLEKQHKSHTENIISMIINIDLNHVSIFCLCHVFSSINRTKIMKEKDYCISTWKNFEQKMKLRKEFDEIIISCTSQRVLDFPSLNFIR